MKVDPRVVIGASIGGAFCGIAVAGCLVRATSPGGVSFSWSGASQPILTVKCRLETPADGETGTDIDVGRWAGRGDWTAHGPVQLEIHQTLNGGETLWNTQLHSTDFVGIPRSVPLPKDILIKLNRDAATIVLTGVMDEVQAAGRITIQPHEEFAQAIAGITGARPTPAEALSLTLNDVKFHLVRALASLPQTEHRPKIHEIVSLSQNGADGEYISECAAELGKGSTDRRWTLTDLVMMKQNGVSPEFIGSVHDAGLSLSVAELIQLQSRGLTASFVDELAEAGTFSVNEMIQLRQCGMGPEFIVEAQGADGDAFSVADLVELRNGGVSAEYIEDIRAAAPALGAKDIVRLRHGGVDPEFVQDSIDCGYSFTVAEFVTLRGHGVQTEFLCEIRDPAFENLTVEQIVDARNRGLSAEFVKGLRTPKK